MSDRSATLVVTEPSRRVSSVLERYLASTSAKTTRYLPGAAAEDSERAFRRDVGNLTEKFDAFLAGDQRTESHLVLGKVQSGKTAHLLAMLAWAADAGVSVGVVFTGTTGSLNNQTLVRARSELEAAGEGRVVVIPVPTMGARRAFADFQAEVVDLMRRRVEDPTSAPFPILISMKNQSRANAVMNTLRNVADDVGLRASVLAVDDEADQASPNAFARRGTTAPTYRAIAAVRQLSMRNLWLSYTATPQAVLLTEKSGLLRPDEISVVHPRDGYFGIADAMRDDFQSNLVVVDDWRVRASQQQVRPRSLTEAIWRFFFVSWVRVNLPERFYAKSASRIAHDDRLTSTQMLVHESGRRPDHWRMARLVEDEREDLTRLVWEALTGDEKSLGDVHTGFAAVVDALEPTGAPTMGLIDELVSPEGLASLLHLVQDCRVLVVNSDQQVNRSERPVNDEDYEKHPAWILIGGDILGRGITIPQLVVTYFIRSSNAPNFDTVMQQLRFCGYRRDYAPWTSLHAPQQTFEDLKLMEIVDRVLWERAAHWDRDRIRLTGHQMPRVFYAAPHGARFEPTRVSVRDPGLVDQRLKGESLVGLRRIFEPHDAHANLALLRRWRSECELVPTRVDRGWEVYEDISKPDLVRLLTSWEGDREETLNLAAVAELFDPRLEELGLADVPAVVMVSMLLFDVASEPLRFLDRLDDVLVTRRATVPPGGATFDEWTRAFRTRGFLSPQRRVSLATPHIGDAQRALRRWFPYDAVIVVIEPVLALRESRSRSSALAAGIGLSMLSPGGFELRTIGHP